MTFVSKNCRIAATKRYYALGLKYLDTLAVTSGEGNWITCGKPPYPGYWQLSHVAWPVVIDCAPSVAILLNTQIQGQTLNPQSHLYVIWLFN